MNFLRNILVNRELSSGLNSQAKKWFQEGRRTFNRMPKEEIMKTGKVGETEMNNFLVKNLISPSEEQVRARMAGAARHGERADLPEMTKTFQKRIESNGAGIGPGRRVGDRMRPGDAVARTNNVMKKAKDQWTSMREAGGFNSPLNPIPSTLHQKKGVA